MSVLNSLAASVLLLFVAGVAGAATPADFLFGTSTDGSNLPFRYFVPPGYDSAQAYPGGTTTRRNSTTTRTVRCN